MREAGAWSVMASYKGVNGATMTESPMLREVLHDEWGFDGVVMSDWFAHRSTEAAGNAALDLSMPGPAGPWGDALVGPHGGTTAASERRRSGTACIVLGLAADPGTNPGGR